MGEESFHGHDVYSWVVYGTDANYYKETAAEAPADRKPASLVMGFQDYKWLPETYKSDVNESVFKLPS